MKAVTTFSANGYQKYGKKCLESLVKNWPSEIVVFYEEKPDLEHEKLIYRSLDEIPERAKFLEMASKVEYANGMKDGEYNFMHDAVKFCHKAFAQMAVEDDHVFWVDADTVAFKPVPQPFLDEMLRDVPYCFFGRDTWTETGFIGFNQTHQLFPLLKRQYLKIYQSGMIFNCLGWHDCFAFDFARMGLQGRNLSPGGYGTDHVIATSPLGNYLDHMKGNRKNIGHSPEQRVRWWETKKQWDEVFSG